MIFQKVPSIVLIQSLWLDTAQAIFKFRIFLEEPKFLISSVGDPSLPHWCDFLSKTSSNESYQKIFDSPVRDACPPQNGRIF